MNIPPPGKRSVILFSDLAARLSGRRRQSRTLLIGIGGGRCAGKSAFASRLTRSFDQGHTSVLPMDDFYHPSARRLAAVAAPGSPGDEYDWRRLIAQVLAPLRHDMVGRYQRYDWSGDSLSEWYTVPTGGAVLVEGVYALLEELEPYYDFRIWVECPAEIRLSRGLARDGESARGRWMEQWMPREEEYFRTARPRDRVDLCVDGSGQTAPDSETQFISLEV